MRKVCLLGASGSIGSQTIDILKKDRTNFKLVGFSVGERINVVDSIINEFPECNFICVKKHEDYLKLSEKYANLNLFYGDSGLVELIKKCNCDMVVNALVGFSGLIPSVTALEENKVLALANKESLVVGGDIINGLLKQGKGKLVPIDSEHVAIAKIFSRYSFDDIETLFITASGGSFRDKSRDQLEDVTVEDALNHPSWSMGAKITIDSATMMNKGFEVIEAKVLFDFPLEKTKISMHKESYVHSYVKLKNGMFVADVSKPDMHVPIEYALYEGNVDFKLYVVSNLTELGDFHFAEFNSGRYPAVSIALDAFKTGGTARAILNRANEEAVYAFLDKKIKFTQIEKIISQALANLSIINQPSLEEIVEADKQAKEFVNNLVEGK